MGVHVLLLTMVTVNLTKVEPFYSCNSKGHPRSALPTLVAYPMSRAFHANKPGAIYDTTFTITGVIGFTEPTPTERELTLRYPIGSTAAPSITAAQRHTISGNCMDQRCLSHLINHCLNTSALQNVEHFFQPNVLIHTPHDIKGGGGIRRSHPPLIPCCTASCM